MTGNVSAWDLVLAATTYREDAWTNLFTGFGTSRDATTQSVYLQDAPLMPQMLTPIYNGSSTARKIVNLEPGEMLRKGYELKCDAPGIATRITDEAHRLGLDDALFRGLVNGRLYGSGLVWLGADDGRDPSEPLDITKVQHFDFLEIFDPRFSIPNPGGSILKPDRYLCFGIEGGSAVIHKSRMLWFRGVHTDDLTRRGNRGWDYSILQALLPDIQAFDEAFHSMFVMLKDASQAVIKLQGLFDALSGNNADKFRMRAQILDMSRSVARALLLDQDESFEKVATQFAGVADSLDRAAEKLAAATGIPVTILMGKSPAGLNSTGESDIRIFYDHVASERKKTLERPLKQALSLIGLTMGYKGEIEIEWPSLWQESPKEEADTRKTVAEADKIYEEMGAVTPETIAKSRWGKDKYSAEMHYDPDDVPTWAAQPKNVTQDPIGGKPAAGAPVQKDHLTGKPAHDIPTEEAAGKPHDQAVAIALKEERG